MAKQILRGLRVAALAADGFEQLELTQPMDMLEKRGAKVEVISLRPGSIKGVNLIYPGKSVDVDRTIFTANQSDYDALLIPGGYVNPDFLRQSERVLEFVREFDRLAKPIAVICHAPWVLISAGLVRGRRLTSWPGIKDDVRNAGGLWEDEAAVRDGNWVSSRGPHDLVQFGDAMIELFAERLPFTPEQEDLPSGALSRWGIMGGVGLALAAVAYGFGRRNNSDH